MNILRIWKELYTGKNNLVAQLGIFALIAIMSISFNEVVSVFIGNNIFSIFTVPSTTEATVFAIAGIMIFIYFTGYIYQFVHENYQSEKIELPSISMNCFTVFAKIFPLVLVWGLYISLIIFAGQILFVQNRIEFYLLLLFLLILAPFVNMVFLIFANNFKYERKLFNPLILVNIMSVTFIHVIRFLIQFIITGFIISLTSGYLFEFSLNISSRELQILFMLLTLCITSYLQQVLALAYYKGLTDIIKKYYFISKN